MRGIKQPLSQGRRVTRVYIFIIKACNLSLAFMTQLCAIEQVQNERVKRHSNRLKICGDG